MVDRAAIAELLLDRLGDDRAGVRTREQTWSWDEVVRESANRAAVADALRRNRPFHIGILLDNEPEFLFWLGGAALAGAAVVGINPTRRGAALEQEVRYVDCQLIVTDTAGKQLLDGLELGVAEDRILLVDSPGYAQLLAQHRVNQVEVAPGVDASALFLLLFTSGTTGMSKAVRCSQGRLTRLAYANSRKYHIGRDDVCYCCMPLFHGNALMALWAPALASGSTICLVRKFSASGFLPDVKYYGATYFTYVGKALGYLMSTPEGPEDGDNTLTHGFGTEASPDDQIEFVRRFGAYLVEGYGSSEGAGSIKLDPDSPPGALGRPAHEGIAIVDPDTRQTCPRAVLDEHGRVLNSEEAIGEMVNKEGVRAFEGYYKNDEANAERIRHGWYWTGDLGYVDGAGFIYFAGRKGDWIRVDGENTSALMIERIVRRHPKVVTAGVYAVPDPRSGDQAMAALEVTDPESFDLDEFRDFLAAQSDLGTKSTPRFVRVSGNLPTTGSNKVQKNVLQAQGWRCSDPVYHWAGRGPTEYELMSDTDKDAVEAEFAEHGRQRLLSV